MSDDDLRAALAMELFGYDRVWIDSGGELFGSRKGTMTTVPSRIPNWPKDPRSIPLLESILNEEGLLPAYSSRLNRTVGDASAAPPRQRAEAALEVTRLRRN